MEEMFKKAVEELKKATKELLAVLKKINESA